MAGAGLCALAALWGCSLGPECRLVLHAHAVPCGADVSLSHCSDLLLAQPASASIKQGENRSRGQRPASLQPRCYRLQPEAGHFLAMSEAGRRLVLRHSGQLLCQGLLCSRGDAGCWQCPCTSRAACAPHCSPSTGIGMTPACFFVWGLLRTAPWCCVYPA